MYSTNSQAPIILFGASGGGSLADTILNGGAFGIIGAILGVIAIVMLAWYIFSTIRKVKRLGGIKP